MEVPSGPRESDQNPNAESLFADYIARLERGEQPDFDALCGAHPDRGEQLRGLHALWTRLQAALASAPGADADSPLPHDAQDPVAPEVLQRLLGRSASFARYRIESELARGGMGIVLRAFDTDLRRHLAMKVILEQRKRGTDGEQDDGQRQVFRFLEEAQVTAQLDHPGIVPVHEVGLDPEGRAYFTMKLVKGRNFDEILGQVARREEGWTQTRALEVILRVCDALAYAHDKRVIHRDLKPSNVMVGKYGEVYVMDWGLARVLGRPDPRDLRIRPNESLSTAVETDRKDVMRQSPDSPLVTMDGHVLGTPAFMSPEQAACKTEELGPRSDVYSIGAMLYQTLSGQRPYMKPGIVANHYALWYRVQEGPPDPLRTIAPDAPAELVAICEKAMARSAAQRYESASALGQDLRAYLEHRVVRAHRTGPVAELSKWIVRNKAPAALLAALVLVLIGSAAVLTWDQRGRAEDRERHLEHTAATLVARADDLWPIHPASVAGMERWIAEARAFIGEAEPYRRELEALRARALPGQTVSNETPEHERLLDQLKTTQNLLSGLASVAQELRTKKVQGLPFDEPDLLTIETELPRFGEDERRLRKRLMAREHLVFANAQDQERHDELAAFVTNVDRLAEPGTGLLEAIAHRLEQSRDLEKISIDDRADEWARAQISIADVDECPAYGGLDLEPQLGLVPLRRNPRSLLWEFWHVTSGKQPTPKDDSEWQLDADTGLILVLVPGGTFTLGAQNKRRDAANFDWMAGRSEEPVRPFALKPFFLSRYEMTQGQWYRLTGTFPSRYQAGTIAGAFPRITRLDPVEQVSWDECDRVLRQIGLEIPTEAQWEYAARAGTSTRYWFTTTRDRLIATFLNAASSELSAAEDKTAPRGVFDHYLTHAPVDAFPASPWGFHSILGNVAEWCRDWFQTQRGGDASNWQPDTGEYSATYRLTKSFRGGSYHYQPSDCRVTRRFDRSPNMADDDLGIRPARAVE